MMYNIGRLLAASAAALALSMSAQAVAADAAAGDKEAVAIDSEAADALVRKEGCTKCHAIDKPKEGPAYKRVAAKYKNKPDAEQKLYTHITTAPIVKNAEGEEDEHKVIKTKDEKAIANLIKWILAQ